MVATAVGLRHPPLPSWNHLPKNFTPPASSPQLICAALSKQGHRLFTSLATADDPAASTRLIRKFIAASSKSVALDAISHLISPTNTSSSRLSSLAFPMYSMISTASWFNWNPKLIAEVIASLYKHGRFDEAEILVTEAVSKLGSRERDLCSFYCNLMDSHSKHRSKQGILDSYERIKQLPSHSSSVYLKKLAYVSIVGSLSAIDLPQEAEFLMEEMKSKGLKPTGFQYRSVVYGYGRLGLFEDMKRVVGLMEGAGFELDVVCSSMVLSSLGARSELLEMVSWLQRMKNSKIPLSIRTYNSVLSSCPGITSIVQNPKGVIIPASMEKLIDDLSSEEALLVQELIEPAVLLEAMEVASSELKLDLHGMHPGSAYLILLQWFQEVRVRFSVGNEAVPAEVMVVCGQGKHSNIRGESPVKQFVKEMMLQMKSPLRIDRKNIGCFVAKGRVLMDWLYHSSST